MTHHSLIEANPQADMEEISSLIAARYNVPLSAITQKGKLTHVLMRVRQAAIQAVHSTGRYRRQDIASFFNVSICTISSSLADHQKAKSRPFTPDEDKLIISSFASGVSIPKITSQLEQRSASSVFRRLHTLKKEDPTLGRFPRPSYKGEVSKRLIQMARVENFRMRENWDL